VTASTSAAGGRVAIAAGCRTPFAKAGTVYRDLTAVDLATACVRELVERAEVDAAWVDTVVMGQVIPSVKAPNLAREVVLRVGLPPAVPAHTVNRACASANEAIAEVASEIRAGHAQVGIAGGAESLSDVPILHSRTMARALVESSRARGMGGRVRAFARVRPRDLVPDTPAIAEPSTGLTMGQSAEKMAKENGITREEQDAIAYASHRDAAAATDDGRLPAEMCAVLVPPRYDDAVTGDNLLRRDTSIEALAALQPVFDRRFGTVTAGNSSPLTDGAAAGLLMSEERGARPRLRAAGLHPRMGGGRGGPGRPAAHGARPGHPEGAGTGRPHAGGHGPHRDARGVRGAGGVEHPGPGVSGWAKEKLGRPAPVGKVDRSRLNVCGGSIALGHPFGATGARLTTTLANELKRRNGRYGLLSVCAQGGMGFAMVLER
jgi:acetyl-CoA acyltransferase